MRKVSIIVSYTDTYQLLENFLKHLHRIITNYNYEVVLIQDGEVGQSVYQLLANFVSENKSVQHIQTSNLHLGYSKVNNLGAARATGDFLLFINTDVFPDFEAIDVLLENLVSSENIGIVQGLLIYPQSNTVQSTGHIFGAYLNKHALCGSKLNNPLLKEKAVRQGVTSAFYLMRKKDFWALNGFDEYFYNAWDGLDLSLRMTYELKKKCLFIPEAKAYHTQGGSRETIFRNTSYQDGYFWHKWKDSLQIDFHQTIINQLLKDEVSREYTLINCSSYPLSTWQPLLKKLKYKEHLDFQIERYSEKEKITLEERFPLEILAGICPILFLTDSFLDLKNNDKIFATINLNRSIIVDLHGNVSHLPDSKVEKE